MLQNIAKALFTPVFFGIFFSLALPAYPQEDWSDRVLRHRDPVIKENQAAWHASKKGVSDETLLRLAERERFGPAVAHAVGQYFEKATKVPESFAAFQAVFNRRDLSDKAIVFAAMSPISDQLITALTSSNEEIDRQIAARMIATLAWMRQSDRHVKVVSKDPKAPDDTPDWLKHDHTEQLKKLIETSKSRVTLECAFHAIALDRNEALLIQAQEHTTHRVPEVAFAARYAVAALGGELDVETMLSDFEGIESGRRKSPLSYDTRQPAVVYLMMAAGQAGIIEAKEPILALLSSRDVHIAVGAARALGHIGGEGLSAQLIGAINDETPWPVRIAIYDAIGANPEIAAVALLRERFNLETGRLRQDVLYALFSIIAAEGVELTIEGFDQWWQANGQSLEIDPRATKAWRVTTKVGDISVPTFAGFYDTAVISDSLVFVVDASKSIDEAELALLHQSLEELFVSLPAEMRFNLVDFGGHVRVLAKGRMLKGDIRDRALDVFLKKTKLTFGTRIFEAIETSMDLPDVDTVHFLSDGQPFASQVNHWQRTAYATRLRCASVPIAIHLVYLPNKGKLEWIAKRPISRYMRDFSNALAGRFHILAPVEK